MRTPEAWFEYWQEQKRVDQAVFGKPPTFTQKLRENWEILTGVTLLTSWGAGSTLILIGDDTWKNIGAILAIESVTIPIGIFVGVKIAQKVNPLIEHFKVSIGEYLYESLRHFHQP